MRNKFLNKFKVNAKKDLILHPLHPNPKRQNTYNQANLYKICLKEYFKWITQHELKFKN